jgi:hypothetical protein
VDRSKRPHRSEPPLSTFNYQWDNIIEYDPSYKPDGRQDIVAGPFAVKVPKHQIESNFNTFVRKNAQYNAYYPEK